MLKERGMWLVASIAIFGIAISPAIQPPWILSIIVILVSGVLFLIRRTQYSAIAMSILALLYGAGIIPLMVFAGTLAIVVLGEAAFRITGGSPHSYLSFILVSTTASVCVMIYLGFEVPLVAVTGVLVAVLLHSALGAREDKLMIETLGVGMTMLLFFELNYHVDLMLLSAALIIAMSFGYFSYRFHAADLSGLFSGALIGMLLIVFTDVRWFLVMLVFFILGSAFTRYKFERKTELGVAESHGGVRGYYNVFANGLVAVTGAVLYGITQETVFIALFLGSVASASADTIASEVGMLGKTPYLITTFKRVPRGTNGGVSLTGEFAAIIAAFLVTLAAFLLGIADISLLIVATTAGFVGTNVDSIVGATLENSGKVGNAGTNFISTLVAGIFAMLFYL